MAAIVARRSLRSFPLDPLLLAAFVALVTLGLVMVASSSVAMSDRNYGEPLHFFWRQCAAVGFGAVAGLGVLRAPLALWERYSIQLLGLSAFLLLLVLIPGIGREVNGSMRWIDLGAVNLQSSEPAKLGVIAYVASYMVRQGDKVRGSFSGFIVPVLVATGMAFLLLLEPDYGGAVVLFATTLGMLFLGGVPLTRFCAWMLAAIAVLGSLALHSPYRMQRLTSFIDPWQDPYHSGFQLTQALIAFGRGEWFGVGLGSGVQKLFYLPEAHTDFVFAVLAEEFGLLGSALVVLLFAFVIWRTFVIAAAAEQSGRMYAAYLAYGIGLIIGLQAFVNIGVNMGVLPTKGLTLPLVSYGSNSMVMCCLLFALLLRVEMENRSVRHRALPEVTPTYVA
ncbi:MAG: putative lipid II flippase FtsW [Gammaproteobacteria bacterium]|nr:putative lipid II flippase FtsW [Gammaproteobacteria bacterium]